MKTQNNCNIWKLLSAIALNFILVMGIPYTFTFPVVQKSWIILLITGITISIKTILGDIISGEFLYHKHGYDFCVVSLGTSMSMLSLQVLTAKNLLPGLENAHFRSFLSQHITSSSNITIVYLSFLLIISSIATLITARISSSINNESPKFPNLLSIINFIIGSVIIGMYLLLIISKG